MFKEERGRYAFKWEDLGNIGGGRANLGPNVPVWAYRLMQFTLRDVLTARFGAQVANEIVVEAGRIAGMEFCGNMLKPGLVFEEFISHLQHTLQEQKIGILRMEKSDQETLCFTLAVAEDLDCSGLPFTDEVVCKYDEGFIAGIFECYTGKPFQAKEIDCWASGDRVCRFEVGRIKETI